MIPNQVTLLIFTFLSRTVLLQNPTTNSLDFSTYL